MDIKIYCHKCKNKTQHEIIKPVEDRDIIEFKCIECNEQNQYLHIFETKLKTKENEKRNYDYFK